MPQIKSFRVKNYRLLEDIPNLEIRPFTFLFGANSSGKSSLFESIDLFRAILMDVKTNNYDSRKSKFKLKLNKNIGTYEDIVHRNQKDKEISFEIVLDPKGYKGPKFTSNFYSAPGDLLLKYSFSQKGLSGFQKDTEVSLRGWEIKDTKSGFILKFDPSEGMFIFLGNFTKENVERFVAQNYANFDHSTAESNSLELRKLAKSNPLELNYVLNFLLYWVCFASKPKLTIFNINEFDFYFSDSSLRKIFGNPLGKELFDKMRELWGSNISDQELTENEHSVYNIFYLLNLILDLIRPFCNYSFGVLTELLSSTEHLDHIRNEVPSFFSVSDDRNKEEEKALLQELLDMFISSPQNQSPGDEDPDEPQIIIEVIEKNKEGEEEVRRISLDDLLIKANGPVEKLNSMLKYLELAEEIDFKKMDEVYKFFIRSKGAEVNLANTSSGHRQVLPILTKIAKRTNDPYRLILIEQPELHLHPKLQARLMEVIVKCREKKKLIFETHSEHMIRKLQVMIAKGEVSRSDVAIYHFDSSSGSTKIKEMEIEENGFFKDPWPDGFFDDSYNLAVELIYASKN